MEYGYFIRAETKSQLANNSSAKKNCSTQETAIFNKYPLKFHFCNQGRAKTPKLYVCSNCKVQVCFTENCMK